MTVDSSEQKTARIVSIPRTREYVEGGKEISGRTEDQICREEGARYSPGGTPPRTPKKQETQATFKDDPLIREALEIFKGEIKTVND